MAKSDLTESSGGKNNESMWQSVTLVKVWREKYRGNVAKSDLSESYGGKGRGNLSKSDLSEVWRVAKFDLSEVCRVAKFDLSEVWRVAFGGLITGGLLYIYVATVHLLSTVLICVITEI